MKALNLTLAALSFTFTATMAVATTAHAAPHGKQVEDMLQSPGARELMDEEVQSWQRTVETKRMSIRADVSVAGTVLLRGTPSPAQRFNRGKLIRCDVRFIGGGQFAATRNACDTENPVYLPISTPGQDQPTNVAPGFYVLGFENSVYPGFVQVKTGQTLAIDLQAVPVPEGGAVKIYRDLNALTEEVKMYFTTYVLGEPVFKLAEYSFGDLYIKSFGTRDGAVALDYKVCERSKLPKLTTKGERLCKAYNMGTFLMLTEMFTFNTNGSYLQYEVGPQGKPYPYKFGRLLVAKRTNSQIASFVNVLPGQYVIEVTDSKGAISTRSTGPIGSINPANALAMNIGWLPAASQLKMNGGAAISVPQAIDPAADPNAPSDALLAQADADDNAGEYVNTSATCSSSRMWRTDLRAYCTSDATPGCARSAAKVCEPMFDTP
jgi:hypothetical protein